VYRAVLAAQERRGEPLARLVGSQRGGDPYAPVEQVRAQGRLIRTPLVWLTADHSVCRTILRDNRFIVGASPKAVPRLAVEAFLK